MLFAFILATFLTAVSEKRKYMSGIPGANSRAPLLEVIGDLKQRVKVSKCAKIRNRYNQVSHLTQDTNGKVTNSQLDNTNESLPSQGTNKQTRTNA